MKKRMKQMLAFGVAMMLVLGGCAEKQEEPVNEETPKMEENQMTEGEDTLTEIKSEQEKTEIIRINIDTNRKNYYFEGTEDVYLYLQYCDVTAEGGENENLKKNIENWSIEQNEYLRSQADFFEGYAVEDQESNAETFEPYSLLQSVSAARIDGRVVSLIADLYYYDGGDHWKGYREGVNFDAQSGKRLALSDLFIDFENFKSYAVERMIYQLEKNYGEVLFEDYMETVEKMWQYDMEPRWYFDASGIVLVLEQYLVGPHSIGTPEIYLPYDEIKQYIKDAYLPDTQDGVALFRQNQEVYLTLPSGEEAAMMLRSELKNDMMYNALWLGQEKFSLQDYVVVQSAYVVRCEGEIYCLVEVDEASDDYRTYIFRLTEGKLEKVNELYAGIEESNVNIHEIRIHETIYLLGTYSGVKNYHFDENGKFVTEDTEYVLDQNSFVLTTTTDIPVTLEGTESVLPAGSHIILTATDDETYVKFTIQETGQNGMMMVERNENDYYRISIHGMDENDCFDLLPYAG